MIGENDPSKAKPRLAGRGITNYAHAKQVASTLYTTGTAGAISCAPLFPAVIDCAARCLSGLWR
jgi:hypothetical protein